MPPRSLATPSRAPLATSASGPSVSTDSSGRTVVRFGSGDDTVRVTQRADGGLNIISNGTTTPLSADQSSRVLIRGGRGNDSITLDDSVTGTIEMEGDNGDDTLTAGRNAATLRGGQGNDTLIGGAGNDAIEGGDGIDYIEGRAGNDELRGGAGRDVLYGMDGDDRMSGERDADYLDGGVGNDTLEGGDGDDQVMGGAGNDQVSGNRGRDVLAGNSGTDTVRGNEGNDRVFVEAATEFADAATGDTSQVVAYEGALGSSVTVSGDAAFQSRVNSDLEVLRSIPTGQQMLRSLDGTGRRVTIERPANPEQGNQALFNGANARLTVTPGTGGAAPTVTRGPGSDATIGYIPERSVLTNNSSSPWVVRPPVVGLFHEMVHAYDAGSGTIPDGQHPQDGGDLIDNRELMAVGLPYDHDGDGNASTTGTTRPSENNLRAELGLARRDRYKPQP